MPRKDGQPTNRELQERFTSLGAGLYKDYFAAAFHTKNGELDIPSMFREKSLGQFTLSVVHKPYELIHHPIKRGRHPSSYIQAEYATINPVDAYWAKRHPVYGDYLESTNPDIYEARLDIVKKISSVVLDDFIVRPDTCEDGSFQSWYGADIGSGYVERYFDSATRMTNKDWLSRGVTLMEQQSNDLRSREASISPRIHSTNPLTRRESIFYTDLDKTVDSLFGLPETSVVIEQIINKDTELNGYEPKKYLEDCAVTAKHQLKVNEKRFNRYKELGAHQEVFDDLAVSKAKYESLLSRAVQYLESK